ncbi:hypothetical protein PMI09_05033 [Rhizobium sp. CF122]|nr:hypothetical protein PMI09_05033 [Rhizobium sp. CF122]
MRPTMPQNIVALKPKITVIGVGGGGGNAVNNMIAQKLEAQNSLSQTPMHRLFPCQKRRGLASSVSP